MKEEKKKSTLLGWLLLIVLIAITLGLNYIKFFMDEDKNIQEVPVNNSAEEAIMKALNEVTTNFNENEKIKEYNAQGIKMNAVLNNHSIFISYEDKTTTTYEFKYNNLNLTISVANEEENIANFKKIYEILIYAAQKRIGNEENIDTKISNFLNDIKEYNGLTKTVDGNNLVYQMNITTKIKDADESEEVIEETTPADETQEIENAQS